MKAFVKTAAVISPLLLVPLSGCRAPEVKKDYPLQPVSFTDVTIDDAFWSPRLETNRKVTIPYCFQRCEETGRIHNFAVAGGLADGDYQGRRYNDSDVYKVIEGASYSLQVHPDAELEAYLDSLIALIGTAQEEDGYLSTPRTIIKTGLAERFNGMYGNDARWSRVDQSHELYCAGHLYEAAAAHYLATGKRSLLDVALRNADLVCREFGPDAIRDVPGHEEIEIGLVKLYRITGNEKYLETARFFIDERGHYNGREPHHYLDDYTYNQDHLPILEQTEPVGHVVRALYLYSGIADIAAISGDSSYLKPLNAIWNNITGKKLYLTGNMGVQDYNEGFGEEYMLPNLRAYNETCAGIGNALWNHRMFLLSGDSKYLDILERDLYNGILPGVSLEGNTFFYPNPLASEGNYERSPWFDCACCPTNIARFMPSIPGYIYARKGDEIYVNLFIAGTTEIDLPGNRVNIRQETDYPWNGRVTVIVDPEKSREFGIRIRIPGWSRNHVVPGDLYAFLDPDDSRPALSLNGAGIEMNLENGFAVIRRKWHRGYRIELDLPMPVRNVSASIHVSEDQGKEALERGPIVYCAEGTDNGGKALQLRIPTLGDLVAEYRPDMLNGIMVITSRDGQFTAIPYYAWANRGRTEMAVWMDRYE